MSGTAVQQSFSAAAATYDQVDGVQPGVARHLAARLPAALPPEARILEVGCGTGNLTELVRRRYPQQALVALDLAPGMVAAAQRRVAASCGAAAAAATDWVEADVQNPGGYAPTHSFDLVVSSSALHWVQPLPAVLARLAGWLAPGGRLQCALMTAGTLAELHAARVAVAPHKALAQRELPTAAVVVAAVAQAGLVVQAAAEEEMQVRLPSAQDLLALLARQGVAAGFYGSGAVLNRTELRRLMQEYDRRQALPDGGVQVTWRVLYMDCSRPCDGR